jgi:hypothetical protein
VAVVAIVLTMETAEEAQTPRKISLVLLES